MKSFISHCLIKQSGAITIEYDLIAADIAVVIVTAVQTVGTALTIT